MLALSHVLFPEILSSQRSAGDIMIRNIQLRHAGKYTCAVQTKVDSVSIATDVVVRGKCECFSWLHDVNSRMGTKLLCATNKIQSDHVCHVHMIPKVE